MVGKFLYYFFEWYSGIAFLAFLFLAAGTNIGGVDSFFKALIWPVVACEHVDTCNQKILGNNIEKNIDIER